MACLPPVKSVCFVHGRGWYYKEGEGKEGGGGSGEGGFEEEDRRKKSKVCMFVYS